MGRHSAAARVDETTPPTGAVTDPRLFDRPLPTARRTEIAPTPVVRPPALVQATASARTGPISRPVTVAPAAFRAAPALRPAPIATITSPLTTAPEWVIDDSAVDDAVTALPYDPVSVRSSVPRRSDRVVPPVAGASMLGRGSARPAQQRYARTGPIQIVTDEPDVQPRRAPSVFTRRREAALAAAALAVVGAMSGAAALLPSANSDAQAATKLDPVSAPMPSASGSSNGVYCLSPLQLKRAMRHHHHTKTARTANAASLVERPGVASSSKPSASASASASASTSTAPSSSPSSSSSGSSSSTTPLIDLPALIGALPMIPSNLLSGLYSLKDFATQSSGAVIAGGKLHGDGVGKTVVAMTKNSSTKASSVPGNGNNQGGLANPVNPLYLLRGVTDLQDVTIQGTEQGHLYNGLYMTGSNLVIKHVQINDIPGNSNANPGETFAVGVNRASGTGTVDDLTINGGSGALSSAAGLAINNSDANWNISDLTTKNLKYSAGIALWQVRGTMNIHDYVQKGGARALGAERMAGTVNLYDPKWDAGTTGHDVTYTWDGGYSGGSINFYYSSAADVPDRKITIITNKASGIAGSVHVYIGGVQQTTSKYVTVN